MNNAAAMMTVDADDRPASGAMPIEAPERSGKTSAYPAGAGPLASILADQGNRLFRLRSVLPVPLLGFLAALAWLQPPFPAACPAWIALSLGTGLLGLAIRCWVAGHAPGGACGRGTAAPGGSRLNTSGPYSVVRHPLYLGNFLLWMSPALYTRSVAAVVLVAAVFWFIYERIMIAEERFLIARFGDGFREWSRRTPAIVPSLRSWQPPELPFSARTVVRREYSAFAGWLMALALLDLAAVLGSTGRFGLTSGWSVTAPLIVAGFLLCRTLKRRTRLLHAPGR